jgi:hypothetical protein
VGRTTRQFAGEGILAASWSPDGNRARIVVAPAAPPNNGSFFAARLDGGARAFLTYMVERELVWRPWRYPHLWRHRALVNHRAKRHGAAAGVKADRNCAIRQQALQPGHVLAGSGCALDECKTFSRP